jgi:histidinol-phosphatase
VASRRDDLSLALELADLADSITLRHFRSEGLVVETKPDMTPVSQADKEVEQVVRKRLDETCPGDAVVGEEYGSSDGHGGRRWIIDPIDGTKGYVRGMPVWATLLALQEDDELTVGVISAPALRRRWWAVRGQGAHVDDGLSARPRRIQVSAIRDLADAQLSFGDLEGWEEIGRLDGLLELSRRCWRTRGIGDFWSYMLVAEGSAEIACDSLASVWDLAASQVILEEAGGRQSDLTGEDRPDGGNGLATNGLLHEAALAILGS